MAKYLPGRFGGDVSTAEAGITLRHLLTMSSGLAPVDYGAVQESDDWVGAALDRPLDEDARGKIFAYDTPVRSVCRHALSSPSVRIRCPIPSPECPAGPAPQFPSRCASYTDQLVIQQLQVSHQASS